MMLTTVKLLTVTVDKITYNWQLFPERLGIRVYNVIREECTV